MTEEENVFTREYLIQIIDGNFTCQINRLTHDDPFWERVDKEDREKFIKEKEDFLEKSKSMSLEDLQKKYESIFYLENLAKIGRTLLEGTEVSDEEKEAMLDLSEASYLTNYPHYKETEFLAKAPISESFIIEYSTLAPDINKVIKTSKIEYLKSFITENLQEIASILSNEEESEQESINKLHTLVQSIFSFNIVVKSVVNYQGNWHVTFLLEDEKPRPLQLVLKLIR